MAIRMVKYVDVSQIRNEDLRKEASEIVVPLGYNRLDFGYAQTMPVDHDSPPIEGLFDSRFGRGMCAWGGDTSDWMDCDSLLDLFEKYVQNFRV